MNNQSTITTRTTSTSNRAPVIVNSNARPLYRGTQVIWYILDILEVILALRFVLKLLDANPAAGFTNFIYSISAPLVNPFINVFRASYVQGSVFEWTTLLAMLFYWLVAIAIIRLFVMNKPLSSSEANAKLNRQDPI